MPAAVFNVSLRIALSAGTLSRDVGEGKRSPRGLLVGGYSAGTTPGSSLATTAFGMRSQNSEMTADMSAKAASA